MKVPFASAVLLCCAISGFAAEDPNAALNALRGLASKGASAPALPAPAPSEITVQSASTSAVSIPWQDAAKYPGQLVEVEGEITSVYKDKANRFAAMRFGDRGTLSAVIFQSAFGKFAKDPASFDPQALFQRKIVRITGVVKLYQNAPEIVVEDPSQLAVQADAPPTKVYNWEEIKADKVGQWVTLEGVVTEGKAYPRDVRLNFFHNWKDYVSVVIFSRNFPGILAEQEPSATETDADKQARADRVLAKFSGKKIHASGFVKLYQSDPTMPGLLEVIVNAAKDIELVP